MGQILYVSREFYGWLRNGSRVPHGWSFMPGLECPLRVTSMLPTLRRTGRIIQRDRFAEYGPEDMSWAEPAGLAAWEVEECHAMLATEPETTFVFEIEPPRRLYPPIGLIKFGGR